MPTCLLWSECQSVTVSLTDFPVTRAFIHSDGRYLFRVKALWQAYAAKGLTTTYCHWMKHWFQSLEEAGVPPSELIKPSTKHGFVNAYAMSVAALIGLMFRILQAKGRRPETVLETLRVLTALDGFCRQCVETTIAQDVLIADVPVPLIYLRGQGLANFEKVVGLLEDRDFASSAWAAHSGVSQAHSGEARARISLRSAFSCPSLLDACLFGTCLLARQRRKLLPVFSAAEQIFATLVRQFFGVVYPQSHDVGALPRGASRDWDPELVWHFFEKAKRFRATLSHTVRMSELAPDAVPDTSGGTTAHWMRKFLAMYARKRSLGFKGVRHISVAIDPSSHSGEELMPGTAYSWENDVTAALPLKVPRLITVWDQGWWIWKALVTGLLPDSQG